MLPCKHFVAIMRDIKDWSWSKFPVSYRCSPYLTLDEFVNPKSFKEEQEEEQSDGQANASTCDANEGKRTLGSWMLFFNYLLLFNICYIF